MFRYLDCYYNYQLCDMSFAIGFENTDHPARLYQNISEFTSGDHIHQIGSKYGYTYWTTFFD